MRKQKITRPRPELAAWPQSKANIGNFVGAKMTSGEGPKTTPSQIAAICAAMDNMPTPAPRTTPEGREGDYILPKLPPSGMRFQQPKKTVVRRTVIRG